MFLPPFFLFAHANIVLFQSAVPEFRAGNRGFRVSSVRLLYLQRVSAATFAECLGECVKVIKCQAAENRSVDARQLYCVRLYARVRSQSSTEVPKNAASCLHRFPSRYLIHFRYRNSRIVFRGLTPRPGPVSAWFAFSGSLACSICILLLTRKAVSQASHTPSQLLIHHRSQCYIVHLEQ